MSLTNEIRRIKSKLKVIEQEGSIQVIQDLLDLKNQTPQDNAPEDPVSILKKLYYARLTDLLGKQDRLRQGTLNFQ